jgi:hypothetical protein
MTFLEHLKSIDNQESLDDAIKYINDAFIEIQYSYYDEPYLIGFDNSIAVIDVFFELLEKKYFDERCIYSLALIELLADYFERYRCVSALFQIKNLVDGASPLKNRINAALLFHRVNNATIDYLERFDKIINNLSLAHEDGEVYYKSTITFINFYHTAISSFIRLNRDDLIQQFVDKVKVVKNDHIFLREKVVDQLLDIPISSFAEGFNTFYNSISAFIKSKLTKGGSKERLDAEDSPYSEALSGLRNRDFSSVRQLSVQYLNRLDDRTKAELKERLDNGVKIIDDTDLLYAYFFAFGKMHFSKVYEAIGKISDEIKNQQIDLIDWGCGQALASMVFMEFMEKEKIKIDIKRVTLIEPSKLALKRGIAHLSIFYPTIKDSINAVCKDLDSINNSDLPNSTKVKVHLFSNILDVPYFNLNELCKRIEFLKGTNVLICVSPVITEIGRQVRLPKFFEFFKTNFKTKVYSETFNTKLRNKWKSNNCPCENHHNDTYFCKGAWTRHEIVFSSLIS